MVKFKNWTKDCDKGIKEKFKETLGIYEPKPRIEIENSIIESQISELDNKIVQAKDRETYLFNRVVAAIQSHNDVSSKILSNDLARLPRIQNVSKRARRTLEQVSIRNSTISDLLEVMETLEPVINPAKALKSTIRKFQPDMNTEINYVQMITNSVMSESNQNSNVNIDILSDESYNDIDQIMAEASHNTKE